MMIIMGLDPGTSGGISIVRNPPKQTSSNHIC